MIPEFSPTYPDDSEIRGVEFDFSVECDMLRLGVPCRNDTQAGIMCITQSGNHRTFAICDLCGEEMFMSGPQQTAYWRGKQKEWGVR